MLSDKEIMSCFLFGGSVDYHHHAYAIVGINELNRTCTLCDRYDNPTDPSSLLTDVSFDDLKEHQSYINQAQ